MISAASIVSGSIRDARVRDLITANKFFKILKSTEVVLSFLKIEAIASTALIWFSDASFGNLKCGGSQVGMIVFIEGSNGKHMPVTWQSRKLRRVVKSTLTAETLALQEVSEVAFMIKCTLLEILNFKCWKPNLANSKYLHDAVYCSNNPTEKRFKIELCSIQESLEKGCLTKEGASCEKLHDALNGKTKLFNVKKSEKR